MVKQICGMRASRGWQYPGVLLRNMLLELGYIAMLFLFVISDTVIGVCFLFLDTISHTIVKFIIPVRVVRW